MNDMYVIRAYCKSIGSSLYLAKRTDEETDEPYDTWTKDLKQATIFPAPRLAMMEWEAFRTKDKTETRNPDINYDVMKIAFERELPLDDFDKSTRPNPDEKG